jgi:ribonuclease D
MAVTVHRGDLPKELAARLGRSDAVAVDTETMGLLPGRDRLCLVQLSGGDGEAHLVRFDGADYRAPRLGALLADEKVTKLFHFARFDVAVLRHYLGVTCAPIYCTKIASRLARTFTDRHGLKDLCKDVLGIELSKEQQSSDWGAPELTAEQLGYAAGDVLHLHQIRARLDEMLAREGRSDLAAACFAFLPTRALLDLAGWRDSDPFAH